MQKLSCKGILRLQRGGRMTDQELKPCPFCGGKADAWESTFCVWKVFCTECGANITLNTDENADVLWNKRVGEVAE